MRWLDQEKGGKSSIFGKEKRKKGAGRVYDF